MPYLTMEGHSFKPLTNHPLTSNSWNWYESILFYFWLIQYFNIIELLKSNVYKTPSTVSLQSIYGLYESKSYYFLQKTHSRVARTWHVFCPSLALLEHLTQREKFRFSKQIVGKLIPYEATRTTTIPSRAYPNRKPRVPER